MICRYIPTDVTRTLKGLDYGVVVDNDDGMICVTLSWEDDDAYALCGKDYESNKKMAKYNI